MAIWNPKLVATSLHSVTQLGSSPIINLPTIQVVKPKAQKFRVVETNVSRRDTLLSLTAATLCGFTFLYAEAAESRVERLENKKKVMEKLEKIREKAGVSRPKSESFAQKPPGERLPPTLVPPLSFPNSKELSSGPTIEAMLP